jgi:hypothetical protein
MAEFTREGAFDHRPEPPTLQAWKGDWIGGVVGFLLLVATLAVAFAVYTRARSHDAAADRDGLRRVRVPAPGDAEYVDYQEMLTHLMFRSSVENSPGYAPPYDPEWRSVLTGRRNAGSVDLEFVNGARSLEELGRFVMLAALDGDGQALVGLAVNKDEFELILWPGFPRPISTFLRRRMELPLFGSDQGHLEGGLALLGKPLTFVGIRSGTFASMRTSASWRTSSSPAAMRARGRPRSSASWARWRSEAVATRCTCTRSDPPRAGACPWPGFWFTLGGG